MAHRLNCYDGGVVPSDSNNTYNAVVERDANGNVNFAIATMLGLVNSGGTKFAATNAATATCTIPSTLTFVPLNTTAGSFTATLPPASTVPGQVFFIYKTDSSANVATVAGNGSENINGANTYGGLSAQFKMGLFFCDGTQWIGGKLS